MNQVNIDLNIRAFSKLYQYCADRRYHLVNKTERGIGDVWERAEVINQNIKKQYDIDAFNIEDESQYLNYEIALGKYILNFNHKYILKGRNIGDEISLMLGARDYPVEKFKNKNLDDIEDFAFSDDLKLTSNKIQKIIQNTIKVKVYQEKNSDIENYFVISKMNYKNLDRIFIIHAKGAERFGSFTMLEKFSSSLGTVTGVVKKHDSKIAIASIMIVKENSVYSNVTNPIRLFVELIDRYGIDVKTEGKKRRFHKNLPINIKPLFEKKYYVNTLFESYYHGRDFKQFYAQPFKNFYALDLKRHANDILKGRI